MVSRRLLNRLLHSLTLPTHREALGWWIVTRSFLFTIWGLFGFYTQSDVIYYHESITALFHGAHPSTVLVEYPTPLIWLLSLPYILGLGTTTGYFIVFVGAFLAADALTGYVLWHSAHQYGTNPRPAAAFWIWFAIAIGPIMYMRLDLLTAILTAAGLIALVRTRRFISGAMIAIGAAIKLWPALLWPPTIVDRKAARSATLGFLTVGGGLALVSLLYGGWERLVSPLTWQSDRGLQVESVFATPLLIARLFDPSRWEVYNSKYNAFEVLGPGTVLLTQVATIATIAGGIVILVLYIGWLRRKDRTAIEAGTLMIIATLIMVITNKTFSPQYMIWLAGPVAALLTISARRPELLAAGEPLFAWFKRPSHIGKDEHLVGPLTLARHIAIWTLVLTVLTQLIYPLLYSHLIEMRVLTPLATIILVVRNVALVYFSIRLIALAFRSIAFQPAETKLPRSRDRRS
ncbi:MAG: DUF2029 domain-containing protein [Propionibacteriaceae bacterium]|jgi:hypothetical protein|nr:DUF2029 domain-containing protein [Propionibacteriaceae bacterium]